MWRCHLPLIYIVSIVLFLSFKSHAQAKNRGNLDQKLSPMRIIKAISVGLIAFIFLSFIAYLMSDFSVPPFRLAVSPSLAGSISDPFTTVLSGTAHSLSLSSLSSLAGLTDRITFDATIVTADELATHLDVGHALLSSSFFGLPAALHDAWLPTALARVATDPDTVIIPMSSVWNIGGIFKVPVATWAALSGLTIATGSPAVALVLTAAGATPIITTTDPPAGIDGIVPAPLSRAATLATEYGLVHAYAPSWAGETTLVVAAIDGYFWNSVLDAETQVDLRAALESDRWCVAAGNTISSAAGWTALRAVPGMTVHSWDAAFITSAKVATDAVSATLSSQSSLWNDLSASRAAFSTVGAKDILAQEEAYSALFRGL